MAARLVPRKKRYREIAVWGGHPIGTAGCHTASGGGQGPVSGGIFNWQTLALQKPDGMALAALVALQESESKERSQGEQREKITRQRAVGREEAFPVRGETGTTAHPPGKQALGNLISALC